MPVSDHLNTSSLYQDFIQPEANSTGVGAQKKQFSSMNGVPCQWQRQNLLRIV
jgi:hypothetical protein